MGRLVVCFALFSTLAVTQQQIVFKTHENGELIAPGNTITIGNASDVFIDVQCITSDDLTKQWSLSPDRSPLPSPLDSSTTSFNRDDGHLRLYSNFVQEHTTQNHILNFQCLSGNSTALIGVTLSPTLFFDTPFPDTIPLSGSLLPLCLDRLPTFPSSNVTVQSGSSGNGTSYSYCLVDTDRGTYRSESVVLGSTNTTAVLGFSEYFPPEVVHWLTDDSDKIRLCCQVSGSASGTLNVYFLRNGVRIPHTRSMATEDGVYIRETNAMSNRVLIIEGRRGNEGVYQCMGQGGEDSSTAITSTTYVNMQYLDRPTITISSDTSRQLDPVIILGQRDTPTEVVLNCSVEGHPIPSLIWTRRNGDVFQEVEGRQAVTGYRETAFSVLRVPVSELKTHVEFICTAVTGEHSENTSMTITSYSDVVFSRHPNESDSDTGSPGNILTCVASSIPIPEIKWFRVQNQFSVQLTNRSQSLIHTEIDGCAVTSTLQLAPITNFRSVTGFFCNGNNGFFQRDSYVVETSNSVPEKVEASVRDITAHSVLVEWNTPSTLIALSHYYLEIYQYEEDQLTLVRQSFAAQQTFFRINELRPFSRYAVNVVAVNGALNSSTSELVHFQTLEAAPEAAPENVVAEAYDTKRILVSWNPPNTSLQNGVIHRYSIVYHPTTDPSEPYTTDVFSGTEVLLVMPLGPGVSYNFRVAAVTVEEGPFSEGIVQQTYPVPPVFSSEPPQIVPGLDPTETTIPLQLPPTNYSEFSHFWMVVIRLDNSETQQTISSNTTAISTSSDNQPANTPYIVTEMSTNTYLESRRFFVMGDEERTQSLNDFPALYHNRPLLPGSMYTVFVRGFVTTIPPKGTARTKRQTSRQYTVFSSSDLLPVTATQTSDESDGGSELSTVVYVAIGVGSLLVITVFVMILVVRKMMRSMSKKTAQSDNELKYENVTSTDQTLQSLNDNTLPRGLTVTGEGIRHEEHIYEDPLYLKTSEARTDNAVPIYKVPRPTLSDVDTADLNNESDMGYEVIAPKPKKPKPASRRVHSKSETSHLQPLDLKVHHQLGPVLNQDSVGPETVPSLGNGHYELMQHPSTSEGQNSDPNPVPTGSPAAYLDPLEVSEMQERSLHSYSQPMARVSQDTRSENSSASSSDNVESGGVECANASQVAGNVADVPAGYSLLTATVADRDSKSPGTASPVNHSAAEYANHVAEPPHVAADNEPTPVPEEYVSMKSVVPEHC